MKHLGVLLLPPGWDATPSQGYPQQYVAGTHLSIWVKRDKVEYTSLSKETTRQARLEPRTSRSRVRGVNHSATHASTKNSRNIASLLHAFNVIAWLEVFILLNKNALKRVKSSLLGGERGLF